MESTMKKKSTADFDTFSKEYDIMVRNHIEAMAAGRELNLIPARIKEWDAREGLGLQCDLMLNGKKVGMAHDDGNGGPMDFEFSDPKVEAQFNKDFPGEEFAGVLEKMIVDAQMEKSYQKAAQNNAKKGYGFTVIFDMKGGAYRYAGRKTEAEAAEYVSQKGLKDYRVIKAIGVIVPDPNEVWKTKVTKEAMVNGLEAVVFFSTPEKPLSAFTMRKFTADFLKLELAKRNGTLIQVNKRPSKEELLAVANKRNEAYPQYKGYWDGFGVAVCVKRVLSKARNVYFEVGDVVLCNRETGKDASFMASNGEAVVLAYSEKNGTNTQAFATSFKFVEEPTSKLK